MISNKTFCKCFKMQNLSINKTLLYIRMPINSSLYSLKTIQNGKALYKNRYWHTKLSKNGKNVYITNRNSKRNISTLYTLKI